MNALTRGCFANAAVLLLIFNMAQSATAAVTVVFHDSFDFSAMTADINSSIGSPRQTGTLGTLSYAEKSSTSSGGVDDGLSKLVSSDGEGSLSLSASNPQFTWVSPNHNFLESPNFTVSYTTQPMTNGVQGGNSPSNWTSLVVGANAVGGYPTFDPWATQTFAESSVTEGLGIVIRQNGEYLVYNSAPPDSVTPDYSGSVSPSADGAFRVDLHVRSDAFDGSEARVKLFINGNPVVDYIRAYGFANNYITLGAANFHSTPGLLASHSFDELTVSVPEVEGFTLTAFFSGIVAVFIFIDCRRGKLV